MLEHDVLEKKRWTSEVVIADFLELEHDRWWKQFAASAKKPGKPLPMIVERHGTPHDFSPVVAFHYKVNVHPVTAIQETSWKRLVPLMGKAVRAIPAVTTRETDPEAFSFRKLAAKRKRNLVLIDPNVTIPFRHGQSLHWNGKRFEASHRDKKLGNLPMIDPQELADTHLFRLQYPAYVVATQTFVDAYHDAGLTGLKFAPFGYSPTPRVRPPAPKRLLGAMPAYPSVAAKRGASSTLFKEWQSMWEWTTTGLKNRAWPAKAFKKKPPVKKSALDAFERKYKVELPPGLRFVLEEFASSVEIDHGWVGSADPLASYQHELARHVRSFMFAGKHTLWNFAEMKEIESTQGYLEDVKELEPADACCVPIITAGNGDQVTVHLKTEEVRYWSHDGNASLDCRLGRDLVDFITRWSWLGVPSIDFLPGTPFYDAKKKCLHNTEVAEVKAWHRWLQGHELT